VFRLGVCFQVGNVLVVPLTVLLGVHKLIPLPIKLTRIYASIPDEHLVPRPN